ncbi:MAG: ribokinase [Spirochaetia bacterium]
MRILNYGSLNIDHVYKVSHIVRPGETIGSESLQFFAGGKGANQSVAIAKAGSNVWHAGKIGSDGRWLLNSLTEAGVQTDLVSEYEGPTGHAIIQVNREGENSIILFGGGNKLITDREIDATLSHFVAGDYVVLQNEINSVPQIISKAHQRGMRVYLNPAPFSEDVKSWPLELVDTLIVNESEAAGLAGLTTGSGSPVDVEHILGRLSAEYPSTDIVLTAGKQGAYYARGAETRLHVPIVDAPVVDTTAAGDTFLGYYLVARLSSADPLTAMQRATLAASITVSRAGAMESIPVATELKPNEPRIT